jgi:hypothetical protein
LAAVFSSFSSDKSAATTTNSVLPSHHALAVVDDQVVKKPFAKVTFSELLGEANKLAIVSVPPDTTLEALLGLMNSQKIFTIPIQSRSRRGKFIAVFSTQDILHHILKKTNKTLNKDSARNVLQEKVENLLSLDPEDESYRIWERDYRDTIERVCHCIDCEECIYANA